MKITLRRFLHMVPLFLLSFSAFSKTTGTILLLSANQPPVISPLITVFSCSGVSSHDVPFTIGDDQTPSASLQVTATSDNQSLIPNANIVLGGTGASRTINVTSVAGQAGVATITVFVTDADGSTTTGNYTVTVYALPAFAPITGNLNTCTGAQTILSNASGNGVWSSLNPSVATIDNNGVVTGVSSGSASITYTTANGTCTLGSTTVVTVYDAPVISPINGISSVMQGNSILVNDLTPGGSWTSSDPSVATVTLQGNAEVVTGISGGTTIIRYTVINAGGCSNSVIFPVTVIPNLPPSIASTIVSVSDCSGQSSAALNFSIGDDQTPLNNLLVTASSDNQTLIPDANIVLGGTGGNRTIQINPASGQSGTATITVKVTDNLGSSSTGIIPVKIYALPAFAPITGNTTISIGRQTTLTDPSGGGVWSSQDPAIATVDANGTVTGLAAGTASIFYTTTNGTCHLSSIATVTVIADQPPVISNLITVSSCSGVSSHDLPFTVSDDQTPLNNLILTASSDNQTLIPDANIILGGTGANRTVNVTSVAGQGGMANITVTATDNQGLTATGTFAVTEYKVPPFVPITGNLNICTGIQTILTDASGGGTWSSLNPTIATIDANGVATGLSAGAASIQYTTSNGTCNLNTTTVVTIYDPPVISPINGTGSVLQGNSILVNDLTPGGVWTSSDPSVATVTLQGNAEVVTGISGGTTTILYTVTNAGGCSNTVTLPFTVIPNLPPTIASTIVSVSDCSGQSSSTLSFTIGDDQTPLNNLLVTASSDNQTLIPDGNIVLGGTGGNRTIQINPVSGQSGKATITVTVTDNFGLSSTGIVPVTIYALPAFSQITGNTGICTGTSSLLADALSGGVWSSQNPSIAVVDANGTVTGLSAGTATILYTLTNGTCHLSSIATVTVSDPPTVLPISGPANLMPGSASLVKDITPGGVWTSSNSSVVTVGLQDGQERVNGIGTGIATISYTVTNASGCSATATLTVVVGTPPNQPPVISNLITVFSCSGVSSHDLPFTISDDQTPVNNLMVTASSDNQSLVPNANIVLGGTGANRTINVTSVAGQAGTSNISVTVTDAQGATATGSFTVTEYAIPPFTPITGNFNICTGTQTVLMYATGGGTWSSLNPSIAVIDNQGVVTGISAGTATIQYITANGTCKLTTTNAVTVSDKLPVAPIAGPSSLVQGLSGVLTETTAGGIWSSSNPSVAAVGVQGANEIINGISPGATTISYTVTSPGGCTSTATLPVTILPNEAPSIVSKIVTLSSCSGHAFLPISFTIGDDQTPLDNLIVTATSDNQTLVPDANIILGGTGGNRTISISSVNGQAGTATVTVKVTDNLGLSSSGIIPLTVYAIPVFAPVTGNMTTFVGAQTTLSSTIPGGVWTSLNPAIASVDAFGNVTGLSAGTATIWYTTSNGTCNLSSIASVTVIADLPPVLSSFITVFSCAGISSHDLPFTIGDDQTPLDNLVLTAKSDNQTLVPDANIILGGTGANRTINVTSVAGLSGVATISVSVTDNFGRTTTGTFTVTEYALPAFVPITGNFNICTGAQTTWMNASGNGVWSSLDPTIATIDNSGLVTGVSAGAATIWYTTTNGTCHLSSTAVVNVYDPAVVSPINGSNSLLEGTSILVNDLTSGGSWASSDPQVATVTLQGNAEVVTGISGGTAIISYTVVNAGGCSSMVNLPVTVIPNFPPTISSTIVTVSLCSGQNSTPLSFTIGDDQTPLDNLVVTATSDNQTLIPDANIVLGGSGGNRTIGFLSVSGQAGTATITVRVTDNQGKSSTGMIPITIYGLPVFAPISGNTTISLGRQTTLSSTIAGGVWSSLNPSVATVDANGVVTGISAGTANIWYTQANGTCHLSSIAVVTVSSNQPPIVSPFNTVFSCSGVSSNDLPFTIGDDQTPVNNLKVTATSDNQSLVPNANIILGGTDANRTVHVTSMAGQGGVAHITVTVTDNQGLTTSGTFTVTVDALPQVTAITGYTNLCVGSVATLHDAVAGGTWSSANTSIATISNQGVITILSAGSVIIHYTISNGNGCTADTSVNVIIPAPPAVAAITGNNFVITGNNLTLHDATTGGVWSSSNNAIATVSQAGVIRGINPGPVQISYQISNANGCTASSVKTIDVYSPLSASVKATSITCYGDNSVIAVNATGGSGSYTYQLNNGAGQLSNIFTSGSGIYLITVKDNIDQQVAYTATVALEPLAISVNLLRSVNPTAGLNNGSIQVLALGGNFKFQYSLDGVHYQGSSTFTNLGAGFYHIVVRDGNNCVSRNALSVTLAGAKGTVSGISKSADSLLAAKEIVVNILEAKVYPNPTLSAFTLTASSDVSSLIQIQVYDFSGKLVYQASGEVTATYHFGQNFALGEYVVKVMNKTGVKVIKVIKE